MSKVVRRPSANRDLVEAYRYYARRAGLRVADRFFANAEATFIRLSQIPGMGTPYQSNEPVYATMRYFPIAGFRKYLVFFRPLPTGIEVFRVLHGARDIKGILAEEFGMKENDDEAEEDDT